MPRSEPPAEPPGPPPAEPPPPVPRLVWLAAQRMTGDLHRRLHEAGFDDQRPSDDVVFAHVPPEGIRLTSLAERAGVTKQAMAEVVDSLVARGYVERRPDPGDGRAKLIVFTDRGWAAVATAVDAIGAIERDMVRRLGARRVEALRGALATLVGPAGPGSPRP